MDKKKRDITDIPAGVYCYDENGVCPYWTLQVDKPYQENGYCHFLQKGDWELMGGLLWDQCKECSIFKDINEFDWEPYGKHFWFNVNRLIAKILLWNTIQKQYKLIEKINIILHGKVHRCKFCKKYYITSNQDKITSCCTSCNNNSKLKRNPTNE